MDDAHIYRNNKHVMSINRDIIGIVLDAFFVDAYLSKTISCGCRVLEVCKNWYECGTRHGSCYHHLLVLYSMSYFYIGISFLRYVVQVPGDYEVDYYDCDFDYPLEVTKYRRVIQHSSLHIHFEDPNIEGIHDYLTRTFRVRCIVLPIDPDLKTPIEPFGEEEVNNNNNGLCTYGEKEIVRMFDREEYLPKGTIPTYTKRARGEWGSKNKESFTPSKKVYSFRRYQLDLPRRSSTAYGKRIEQKRRQDEEFSQTTRYLVIIERDLENGVTADNLGFYIWIPYLQIRVRVEYVVRIAYHEHAGYKRFHIPPYGLSEFFMLRMYDEKQMKFQNLYEGTIVKLFPNASAYDFPWNSCWVPNLQIRYSNTPYAIQSSPSSRNTSSVENSSLSFDLESTTTIEKEADDDEVSCKFILPASILGFSFDCNRSSQISILQDFLFRTALNNKGKNKHTNIFFSFSCISRIIEEYTVRQQFLERLETVLQSSLQYPLPEVHDNYNRKVLDLGCFTETYKRCFHDPRGVISRTNRYFYSDPIVFLHPFPDSKFVQ